MFRPAIELLITILIVLVARAILTSVMRGIANAGANVFRRGAGVNGPGRAEGAAAPKGGDLHKDPVCGTYVAESTPFRQNVSGQTFYYCSEACREKHALVAR